jgi:hypothetical protein
VFLVIILIAEICAGVLLYFQKGTLETLIGRPNIISSFQRFLNPKISLLLQSRETARFFFKLSMWVSVVYMARDVMIFMRANSITRANWKGVGPENRDF